MINRDCEGCSFAEEYPKYCDDCPKDSNGEEKKMSSFSSKELKFLRINMFLLNYMLQKEHYDVYEACIKDLIDDDYVDDPEQIQVILMTLRLAFLHKDKIGNWKMLYEMFEQFLKKYKLEGMLKGLDNE